jgi:hypothetical protein
MEEKNSWDKGTYQHINFVKRVARFVKPQGDNGYWTAFL